LAYSFSEHVSTSCILNPLFTTDDDDFFSITNMIYVVKKNVKNDAHDTKNDKSLTYMA